MTDFRLSAVLRAYSGGTVRDLHTILYSSVGLLPRPQTLKGINSLGNRIAPPACFVNRKIGDCEKLPSVLPYKKV